MKIDEIEKLWTAQKRSKNAQSEVDLWNSQSEDPVYHHIPTFDDNEFLKLLQREHMLDKSYDVLDIGCGVGIYSIAVAEKVHSATGFDISTNMLQHGKEIIEKNGINNANLELIDWNTVDLEKMGMKNRFDLVFVHTSPAISSYNAFKKMINASKRYCAICVFATRTQPVMQKVFEIAGAEDNSRFLENSLVYMFDVLLQMGCEPKFHYEKMDYSMNQPYEGACAYYLSRVNMVKKLTESKIADIMNYLASIVEDGVITEKMDPTLITLYWEKQPET